MRGHRMWAISLTAIVTRAVGAAAAQCARTERFPLAARSAWVAQ